MNPNIAYLLDNMNSVAIALAALILIGSLVLWIIWIKKILSLRNIITRLSFKLDESTPTPKDVLGLLREECRSSAIKNLLEETQEGLIELDDDFGKKAFSLRPYNETWNIRSVLSEGVNVPLFESMPNLLIGFGLMCTFIFLPD